MYYLFVQAVVVYAWAMKNPGCFGYVWDYTVNYTTLFIVAPYEFL